MNIHQRIVNWHTEDGVTLFKRMNLPDYSICLDFGCGFGEYSMAQFILTIIIARTIGKS